MPFNTAGKKLYWILLNPAFETNMKVIISPMSILMVV